MRNDHGEHGFRHRDWAVESYIQTWVEDGAYFDESSDDDDYDPNIDEVEEEQKSKRKRVRFAELNTVRPIPSVGKGRATPARGTRARVARDGTRRGVRTVLTSVDVSS